MKYLSFRFDVDTHKCLREGVPNLLQLGKELSVTFTFFINPGKAVDLRKQIKNILSKSKTKSETRHLSALQKLGFKDYCKVLFVNSEIAKSHRDQIISIIKHGHEVGLHGGRNHATWQYDAQRWGKQRLTAEISWGMSQLQLADPHMQLIGFASPTWNSPELLPNVLKSLGFSYIADAHGKKQKVIERRNGIAHIPTVITGEPGGVGYIEYCRAKHMNDEEIKEDFKVRLRDIENYGVIYDHPYYVGAQEIQLLRELIIIAKEMKFKIVPLKTLNKNN